MVRKSGLFLLLVLFSVISLSAHPMLQNSMQMNLAPDKIRNEKLQKLAESGDYSQTGEEQQSWEDMSFLVRAPTSP